MKFLILGIYLFVIIGLSAYLAVVLVHLKWFMQYSRYLRPVTRFYLVLILCITIFWAYHIIKGDSTPRPNFNTIKTQY